jgi:hypothetical protein
MSASSKEGSQSGHPTLSSCTRFTVGGQEHACTAKARFLVETANGTSSYTLERGFGANPEQAVAFYEDLAVVGNKRKRLTMVDEGRRTVIARSLK